MKCYAIGLEHTRILVIKVPKRWVKKKHTKNMVKKKPKQSKRICNYDTYFYMDLSKL